MPTMVKSKKTSRGVGKKRAAPPVSDFGSFETKMWTTIPTTALRHDSSGIVSRVQYGDESLVLTRRGKPAAAIVSLRLLELLRKLEDKAEADAARASRREIAKLGAIGWDDVKAMLDL